MAEKILQCGYISGDMFTAAVFLHLDAGSRIVLVKDTKEPQDQTDKRVLAFYTQCGLAGRVDVINISETALKAKDVWRDLQFAYRDKAPADPDAKGLLLEKRNEIRQKAPNAGQWPRSITSVTGLVSNKFQSNPKAAAEAVAALWKVNAYTVQFRDALADYMVKKFADMLFAFRKNILVLWSRQSGKRGGAHVELDSAFAGIRQLARYFAIQKGSATVLLAGDESKGKLAGLAGESPQIVDVSEMWKDPAWEKEPLKSLSYPAQFAFFKELAGEARLFHLGMRSGMLEGMALLGMETIYLEPVGSLSGDRMLAFNRANIPYSRLVISAPPGLTAFDAHNSMQKEEVKAPTIAGFQSKVNRGATGLMNYKGYTKFYKTAAAAQRDAPLYAKAQLFFPDALKKSPAEARTMMKDYRGFYDADLKTITDQLEALFAK